MSDILEEEESHMRGEGWTKELVIRKVVEKQDGSLTCQEWEFFADTMPCRIKAGGSGPICGIEYTWIRMLNGKLFWSCSAHKIVNGPIAFDGAGVMFNEYPVSADEAYKIYISNGQIVPKSIVDKMRVGKVPRRRRRR